MSIKSIRESLWRLKIYILGHYFPKKLVEYRYKDVYGRSLNWNNPQTLDEKVNWSKFYSDTSAWVRLADKYAVREFVKDRASPNRSCSSTASGTVLRISTGRAFPTSLS